MVIEDRQIVKVETDKEKEEGKGVESPCRFSPDHAVIESQHRRSLALVETRDDNKDKELQGI